MARYLIARLVLSVPTLIAVSIVTFVLTTAARGDPAVLVLSGVRFGHVLAGAVIIGPLFAWPGMGSVLIAAISGRDLPVVGGYVLMRPLPVRPHLPTCQCDAAPRSVLCSGP